MDVMNRASEILGGMKKKNPLLAYKKAVDAEKAEMSALPVEKRMQRMGRPRLGANMPTQFDTGKPSKEELQRRERGASTPIPDYPTH